MEPDSRSAPRPEGTDDFTNNEEKAGDGAGRDQMAPPEVPCECDCLHCRRVFMSDQMWFQRVIGGRHGFDGFWMCPTPNCGGAGFTFDIFPTNPAHPANDGWYDDDEDEGHWVPDMDAPNGDAEPDAEYNPAEAHYSALDEMDNEDDDPEGEEWKHGLAPGEHPPVEPPPPGQEPRTLAEEEALYDAPDRRPREVDWSNRTDPPGGASVDDIPF